MGSSALARGVRVPSAEVHERQAGEQEPAQHCDDELDARHAGFGARRASATTAPSSASVGR
jgi:hypothetical protein